VIAIAAISGFVGIVLQPDTATIAHAYRLAAALLPADAEQVLAPGALPHITLTQCALRDAPVARVKALVARLDEQLAGRTLPLHSVVAFTGGFLFWCVDDTLDPVVNESVVNGTARATGNDPHLVENARRYGYAFVNDRYLPHITLGFAPTAVAALAPQYHTHLMTIEHVILARLGRLGRVEEALTL
jgi:2'-5' RNA ligase